MKADLGPLMEAYRRTHFRVHAAGGDFVLRVGETSSELLALHAEARVRRSCYITAWNPGSRPLARDDNDELQRELERIVSSAGYDVLTGIGEDPNGEWPGEESLLVPGLPLADARSLGHQFGQIAIVWAGADGVPQLVRCAPQGDEVRRFDSPKADERLTRRGAAPDVDDDLCLRCAERAFTAWSGWCADGKNGTPVPLVPSLVGDGCPVCGGDARLARDHVYFVNYHGRYNTGLPDYFYLNVSATEALAWHAKWGEPYRSPLAGRCVPGERAGRFRRLGDGVAREVGETFRRYERSGR